MYVGSEENRIAFRSFDLIDRESVIKRDYPCRYAKCDQFCRDADHVKLGLPPRILESDKTGDTLYQAYL